MLIEYLPYLQEFRVPKVNVRFDEDQPEKEIVLPSKGLLYLHMKLLDFNDIDLVGFGIELFHVPFTQQFLWPLVSLLV